ncbi:MAG: hypothetical protein Q8O92_08100 [Candidatus Latescibacter sp.]|nr:hypothetical protein [Candidatus Latescibacter sp.]
METDNGRRPLIDRVGMVAGASLAVFILMCGASKEVSAGVSLMPDKSKVVTVKKMIVTDSRVVRGFRGTTVDGTLKSYDFRGYFSEYPDSLSEGFDASSGVDYDFNDNDGLHIALKKDSRFNTVVIRGGASTHMYAAANSLIEPSTVQPVCTFTGKDDVETIHLNKPVRTCAVDFFKVKDGTIADLAFFMVESSSKQVGTERWAPTTGNPVLTEPDTKFAPESVKRAIDSLNDGGASTVVSLERTDSAGTPVDFTGGRAVHFVTPPFSADAGLEAVTLSMDVSGVSNGFTCTAVVHDPLDPALDLLWFRFDGAKAGTYRLALDSPDQVLLPGTQMWVTLTFDKNCRVSGPDGGAPEFGFRHVPREKALPEAVEHRKFLLKTLFALLSECRPWGSYQKQARDEYFSMNIYAALCPELFMTIDRCHTLAPDDGMVRQYREWVFVRHLESLSDTGAPPAPPSEVPAWAWYPRQAWLETRRIAQWWFDHRSVPTGEFGGKVGDDTDMYQQFADLPFLERGGIGGQVLDGGARLAELVDKKHVRDGINLLMCDTLHAYEEGINHTAIMARWFYGDPIYLERCMVSARNMEKLTVVTSDGRRHFRDRRNMGHDDLTSPHEPTVDGAATTLMWHTTLQFADYNRNPLALKTVREWADSWLRFLKPGQWATDIEVATGKVLASSKDSPLDGGYRTQACGFSWLYGLTGQEKYLEPFMYYYRRGESPGPAGDFLGDAYSLGLLKSLPAATVDRLAERNPGLAIFRTGAPSRLIEMIIGNPKSSSAVITNLYDAIRWPDMYTSAEQFDDRVFTNISINASKSYLGGFCYRNKFNPTLAVSWSGFGTDYAALVTDNREDRFTVLVYSYADVPLKGSMRVWNLEHGRYRLTVGPDVNGDKVMEASERTEILELAKADDIPLTIKPKAVTVIRVEQVEKLEPIFTRADLAIATREVSVEETSIRGTVHNIGSSAVNDVILAVVDGTGAVIAKKSLGRLDAPLDMVPRTMNFRIDLPRAPEKGWNLVLDPDRAVPEIYEGNNTVNLGSLPAADYRKGWR